MRRTGGGSPTREEKRSKASEARAAKLAQDLADVYQQAASGNSSSREHYLRAESRLQGELEAQRQESAELVKRHDLAQRRFDHERDQYAIQVAKLSVEISSFTTFSFALFHSFLFFCCAGSPCFGQPRFSVFPPLFVTVLRCSVVCLPWSVCWCVVWCAAQG